MCRSAFSILQVCNVYAVKETHKLPNGFMIHLKISGLLKIEMENMTMNTNLGEFLCVLIAIGNRIFLRFESDWQTGNIGCCESNSK